MTAKNSIPQPHNVPKVARVVRNMPKVSTPNPEGIDRKVRTHFENERKVQEGYEIGQNARKVQVSYEIGQNAREVPEPDNAKNRIRKEETGCLDRMMTKENLEKCWAMRRNPLEVVEEPGVWPVRQRKEEAGCLDRKITMENLAKYWTRRKPLEVVEEPGVWPVRQRNVDPPDRTHRYQKSPFQAAGGIGRLGRFLG
jgi:hypothetical protein